MTKIKHKCTGSINYATCTKYETQLPSFSSLTEEDCVTIEETTEDIYNLIEELRENTDVSELENTCITFTEPKTPSSVLAQMYEEFCALKTTLGEQEDIITTLTARIEELETNNCP